MEACLKVVRLGIARQLAGDGSSYEEKNLEYHSHIDACDSCRTFIESLADVDASVMGSEDGQMNIAGQGQNTPPELKRGDRVSLRGRPERIGIVVSEGRGIHDKFYYQVSFHPGESPVTYAGDALEVYIEDPTPVDLLLRREFGTPEEFSAFLILKKLETPLSDNLYTFYSSRTQFEVHQFKPVIKFLNSVDQRLLIADEVGLGKTIEAGIIFEELEARLKGLSRVLVVCPAMLTQKWAGELRTRFGEEFQVLRGPDIAQFIENYANYGDAAQLRGICSQESLRRFTNAFQEYRVHFDLVIVDEAHHWRNSATRLNDLGEVLSEYADAMVMLTATPLHLGSENLFNLLRIMLPQQFNDYSVFERLIEPNEHLNAASRLIAEPQRALKALRQVESTSMKNRFLSNPYYQECVETLAAHGTLSREKAVNVQRKLVELNTLSHVFTRTKKKDIDIEFPTREARVITVDFAYDEMEFYNAVTSFVETRFKAESGSSQGISFARIMPQRQVASCIPAMRAHLKSQVESSTLLRVRDWEGDDVGERWNGRPRITPAERSTTSRLLKAMGKLGDKDSKFDSFIEALRNLEEEFRKQGATLKVIVFSYFKRTLEHLNRRLAQAGYGKRVVMIHGDINQATRERSVERFRENPSIEILLSSEVGSEGLDFQFCNVMFNYDLPWNPMKVEQRIGRLDRYGQKSDKILIYNFSTKGTIDDIILERLYDRINIFRRYIGDLEEILGDKITQLTRTMFDPELTSGQKAARAEETARAIESELRELEEFESVNQRFLGQDEYFTDEISSIRDSKRFITAQEVQHLVQFFLSRVDKTTTLRPTKRGLKDVYVLKASADFRALIRAYSDGMNGRENIIRELERDGGVPVTFDSERASADRQLMFLTIHHPIIRCMVKYLSERSSDHDLGLMPTASLSIKTLTDANGEYMYFVYLLEEYSLKRTLRLVPILVNLRDPEIVHISDELSDMFIGLTPDATEFVPPHTDWYKNEDVLRCSDTANEYIAMFREETEWNLLKGNDALVDIRKDAIRESFGAKIGRVSQTYTNLLSGNGSADERLLRMYRARIRNLEDQQAQAEQELESKRGVNVGFQPLAAGFVHFE